MKLNNIYTKFLAVGFVALVGLSSCKDQLDVKNPNSPTFGGNVNSEDGIAAYAKGGVYWNGFNYGDGWLGDSFFSLPWGYHELMGDAIGGGQGSNNQTTTMGVPTKFVADPTDAANTTFTNTSPQVSIIRSFNTTAATANNNNALFYEWQSMYAMINVCNTTLATLASAGLSKDKASTVSAWCYWWKGYAYANIGTLYCAGLIVDKPNVVVSKFVSQADIITESNRNLTLAQTALSSITSQSEYSTMIGKLIPLQCQVGLGSPLSTTEWAHTINTMLARNILLNKLAPFVNNNPSATIAKSSISPMSAADWQSIITLCNNGVKNGDKVFTGRTSSSNSFFTPSGGSVAGILAASNQVTTYKLSERLVQQFKTGDNRLANFTIANGTFFGDANTNSTRYSLVDGVAKNLSGFAVLGTRTVGAYELFIGPTFEENMLMLAEANIRTGNVSGGVGMIDNVRAYQGAGVKALSTTLSTADALKELSMERLAALSLRGISYFDLRRWGWTYSIANGGGRYGSTILFKGNVYNNATIEYNYMDYWDVPADETSKNTPSSDSAPVLNKNY